MTTSLLKSPGLFSVFCPFSIMLLFIYYSLEFFTSGKLMVFHWRLNDSKSPQVSRTLLSILSVFNNVVLYYSLEFFTSGKLMVFHWRLNNSKSPQVSRTLLSILAVFNNVVVWMVSTRPPTSKSSRPFNNPLVTVTKATIFLLLL